MGGSLAFIIGSHCRGKLGNGGNPTGTSTDVSVQKNINQAAKTFFADASERFLVSHTLSIALFLSLSLLTSSFNAPATSVYYRAEMRK